MTVLSAQTIGTRNKPIVDPQPRTEYVSNGIKTTFGVSACGYDLRLAEAVVLEPGDFVLASASERFDMPTDVVGIVHDKSSWARRGLAVQNTVIEPGWRGFLTLELTNHGSDTLFISDGHGICQVLFHRLDQHTTMPYDGKYQDQESGPQEAR